MFFIFETFLEPVGIGSNIILTPLYVRLSSNILDIFLVQENFKKTKNSAILPTRWGRERSDALMAQPEGEQARGIRVYAERGGSPHAERGTTTRESPGPDHSRSYQCYYLG